MASTMIVPRDGEPPCPLQSKNHFEHDQKIRELIFELDTFKSSIDKTPRLLAQRIIEMEKTAAIRFESNDGRYRQEIARLRKENAELVRQAQEINQILQDATNP